MLKLHLYITYTIHKQAESRVFKVIILGFSDVCMRKNWLKIFFVFLCVILLLLGEFFFKYNLRIFINI